MNLSNIPSYAVHDDADALAQKVVDPDVPHVRRGDADRVDARFESNAARAEHMKIGRHKGDRRVAAEPLFDQRLRKRKVLLRALGPVLDEDALRVDALALDKKLQMEDEALLESLNQSTAQVRQGIRELLAERKEVRQYLSDDVMARYEAAARRFDGLAVETLRASQPSICRVTIPASSFGDIRRGPSITECPYCHRLLVTDGMFDLNA